MTATMPRPSASQLTACDWCERHPDRACPACAARRRRAVRLVERGLSVAAAAELMGVQTALVERLLDDEADRSALATLRRDHVENAPLRPLFRERQRHDPSLTVSELARRVGSSPIQVERWLGLRQTAAKTDRRGRCYPAADAHRDQRRDRRPARPRARLRAV